MLGCLAHVGWTQVKPTLSIITLGTFHGLHLFGGTDLTGCGSCNRLILCRPQEWHQDIVNHDDDSGDDNDIDN